MGCGTKCGSCALHDLITTPSSSIRSVLPEKLLQHCHSCSGMDKVLETLCQRQLQRKELMCIFLLLTSQTQGYLPLLLEHCVPLFHRAGSVC